MTVTYNSAAPLARYWASGVPDGVRWVVVDNASTDGSADVARGLGAEVVVLDRNLGFGAANNVGLARVATAWTLFLNPDVTPGDRHDLTRLAATSRANADALVAPQLVNPDGTDQPNGRGLPYVSAKLAHRSVRLPGNRLDDYTRVGLAEPTYVAWTIGAAVGGSTALLRGLGGWDERYFVYYEDHDLGLRSWRSGHPVVVVPEVRWVHGWARATTRVRLSPWGHEIASAARFYVRYPSLLVRSARSRTRWAPLEASIWRTANGR